MNMFSAGLGENRYCCCVLLIYCIKQPFAKNVMCSATKMSQWGRYSILVAQHKKLEPNRTTSAA